MGGQVVVVTAEAKGIGHDVRGCRLPATRGRSPAPSTTIRGDTVDGRRTLERDAGGSTC